MAKKPIALLTVTLLVSYAELAGEDILIGLTISEDLRIDSQILQLDIDSQNLLENSQTELDDVDFTEIRYDHPET